MHPTDALVAFTVAAILLTITPGLDTALILRTAAVEGPRQAWRAASGINVGCLLWGAAVAFGLGALLLVSEVAYNAVKYCGAAYLCWLGLNMLFRPRSSLGTAPESGQARTNWFLRGVMGNLLNPKIGIFYVSFLPQFIPQGAPLVSWTFGLVAVHVAISLVWAALLIGATRPLGALLRRSAVIKWMDRTMGVVFLFFAARLAFGKR